jgi:hypothetical protein
MRTELTLASSAWRPLGEKIASNAGFYSFPRCATLRDFVPREEKEKNGMSVTRLPTANAQIFPQTPSNLGPGSYEQMHTLADRVGKVDTFVESSLPHGQIDGKGNPHGDRVMDDSGEFTKTRPPVLEPRSGVGGMLQKNSTRGGSISKEFSVRAKNLSGVRNRDKRFRLMHPSTQDVSEDPPPAVGTYEPTVGKFAEHKVDPTGATSIKDKSWRYEFSVGGSTGCWRNRNTVGFWDMPRKQLMQYEKARASYDLVDLADS